MNNTENTFLYSPLSIFSPSRKTVKYSRHYVGVRETKYRYCDCVRRPQRVEKLKKKLIIWVVYKKSFCVVKDRVD